MTGFEMTMALWCVLIAAYMPLLWTAAAKFGGEKKLGPEENRNPREFLATLTGAQARANAAQQNAFEAFPPFAAAVIIAELAGAAQDWVNTLAIAFILFRVAYGVLYIADKGVLRSLAWAGAVACVVALFVAAAGA